MTVHELIQELLKIPNQEQDVRVGIASGFSNVIDDVTRDERIDMVGEYIGKAIAHSDYIHIEHYNSECSFSEQTKGYCLLIDVNSDVGRCFK